MTQDNTHNRAQHYNTQVRAPKFELYQRVTLSWNEEDLDTQVVKRWLDFDEDYWWYELQGLAQKYPESALEPITLADCQTELTGSFCDLDLEMEFAGQEDLEQYLASRSTYGGVAFHDL